MLTFYPTLHQLTNKCGQHKKIWVLHTRAPERGLPERPFASQARPSVSGCLNSQEARPLARPQIASKRRSWEPRRGRRSAAAGARASTTALRYNSPSLQQGPKSDGAPERGHPRRAQRRGARSTTLARSQTTPTSAGKRRRGFASTRKGDAFDCKKEHSESLNGTQKFKRTGMSCCTRPAVLRREDKGARKAWQAKRVRPAGTL